MATNRHPDAAAIDRIGTGALMEHFQISAQAVSYWRLNGVPKQHRNSLRMLGEARDHDMSDFPAVLAA
jgi:hypothetical protein